MNRSRRIAAVAALVLALPLPMAGAAMASSSPSATAPAAVAGASTPAAFHGELPRPTGRYAAGEEVLRLTDRSRTDPWVPSAGPRQLAVSMFYPARQDTGEPAPYMTLGEAQGFVATRVPAGTGLQPQDVVDTKTYAYTGAKAANGKFPLVVLSPGFENPRATLTSLATDLASHGYVVALVGHTYEDSGETLADGSTPGCALCDTGAPDSLPDSRAKDVSFVLDQLTGQHPVWRLSHLIDRDRIGMAGHSIGGASTLNAMAGDRRILAGVNMDGRFWPPVPTDTLKGRSFLLLGKESDHSAGGGDGSWGQTWAGWDGYKPWLTVAGTNHGSFTDVTVLAAEAGIPAPPGTTTSPARGTQLTREYVGAFFDQTLKGIHQPLLDGPSAANPEVLFQHP
ncbi:dienelactone hydrolase [Kitasatospora sp. MAA19]|uniref:alpha/beta hydrolase family protein n=1 Tax=Kitasatospora sp. MAA19 TaxID=3035090 RepID=UPI0024740026|nr:alpha/beta hydrolase [Kitasatospora sp. MAA19]MDH6704937.1 dienelactone hydrolase [Kitasatospora sp. MAA19]